MKKSHGTSSGDPSRQPRGPGAPSWMRYVLTLAFPAGLLLATIVSRLVPDLSDVAFGAITIFLPLVGFVLWGILDRRRRLKAEGLVPQQGGYSAEVDLLAVRLRERARTLENALRFERPMESPHELQAFADELLRTARQSDGQELLPRFTVRHPDEAYLGGGPLPEHVPDGLIAHADALRAAAAQLEEYARDVRERGGLFRLDSGQLLGCGGVLIAIFGIGGWILFSAIRGGGGSFALGGGLIGAATLLSYLLLRMQRERP